MGSLGLAKLPSLIQRLHAPTKAATLGAGGLLLASALYFWLLRGYPSYHELLIGVFLFLYRPDHRPHAGQGEPAAPQARGGRAAADRAAGRLGDAGGRRKEETLSKWHGQPV